MADGDSDYESWATAASSALKGRLEDLTTKTFDDIERFPLYTRDRNENRRREDGLPENHPSLGEVELPATFGGRCDKDILQHAQELTIHSR